MVTSPFSPRFLFKPPKNLFELMASRLGEAGAPGRAAKEMVALLEKSFKK